MAYWLPEATVEHSHAKTVTACLPWILTTTGCDICHVHDTEHKTQCRCRFTFCKTLLNCIKFFGNQGRALCDELLQGLAGEKRRLQSGVAQLERELVAREGQLSGQAGELAALQEAQRDAHAQMNQYVMDLQVKESHHIVMSHCVV